MSYVLTIIHPTDPPRREQYDDHGGASFFDSKFAAALAVLRALPLLGVSTTIGDGKRVGKRLNEEPTGTEIEHVDSGYRFMIEEI